MIDKMAVEPASDGDCEAVFFPKPESPHYLRQVRRDALLKAVQLTAGAVEWDDVANPELVGRYVVKVAQVFEDYMRGRTEEVL